MGSSQGMAHARRRVGHWLLGLLAVGSGGACADGSDPAGPLSTRDQLASAETFRVVTGRSTAALAMTLSTPLDTHTAWLTLPVADGTLVAVARGDELSIEEVGFTVDDLELISWTDARAVDDGDVRGLRLVDMSVRALAPIACAASWSEDGEAASCGGTTVLSVSWALALGEQRVELAPVLVGPLELSLALDHVGDELQLGSWGAVTGVDWAFGPFRAAAMLVFDLEGAARASGAPPPTGIDLDWHEQIEEPRTPSSAPTAPQTDLPWHDTTPDRQSPRDEPGDPGCGPVVECDQGPPTNAP